ncbi:MAG: IclR family transcriptional regulator [Propionibacteriaceae bacterium]
MHTPGPHTVLGKAVLLLRAFAPDDGGLSLAELTRRTGLAKGTVHRVAGDLVGARLLDRSEDGYHLGRQLFELGMRASVERTLLEVATPFLEDLYELTHETVHLGVRDELDVVYVAKIGGHRQAVAPSRVGGRQPLHCTAIGKALLAHAPADVFTAVLTRGLDRRTPRTVTGAGLLRTQLDRVAENGVSFEFEEAAVGLVCVGSPIFGAGGAAVAALSVTGPVTRFRPQVHANAVRAAAAGLSAVLVRRVAHTTGE